MTTFNKFNLSPLTDSKMTFICYSVSDKLKCTYCNFSVNQMNRQIEIHLEFAFPLVISTIPYEIAYIERIGTDKIIQEIVEYVENYFLDLYVRVQEKKQEE